MSEDDGKGRLVVSYQAMLALAGEQEYLMLKDLPAGSMLTLVTERHRYDFLLQRPETYAAVMTSDNVDAPGPREGTLQGSLLHPGGSSLMVGRVGLGLCATFAYVRFRDKIPRELILTPVKEILLNGFRVLPAPEGGTVQ